MSKDPFGVAAAFLCKDEDRDRESNDASKGPENGGHLESQSRTGHGGVKQRLHPAMEATYCPELRQHY